MSKIVYDASTIKCVTIFESLTRANLKDCFLQDEKIVFVVKEGEIGRALGKGGSNIRRLESLFKKKIRIIEFNSSLLQFVKNVVYPLQIKEIHEQEGIVTIVPVDSQTRGYLIGRAASHLRATEEIVKRYFDIKEIKVI